MYSNISWKWKVFGKIFDIISNVFEFIFKYVYIKSICIWILQGYLYVYLQYTFLFTRPHVWSHFSPNSCGRPPTVAESNIGADFGVKHHRATGRRDCRSYAVAERFCQHTGVNAVNWNTSEARQARQGQINVRRFMEIKRLTYTFLTSCGYVVIGNGVKYRTR